VNTAIGWLGIMRPAIYNNTTAIGYNARVNVGNKIRLGNSTVTVIEGRVCLLRWRDLKAAVTETVKGLDFLSWSCDL